MKKRIGLFLVVITVLLSISGCSPSKSTSIKRSDLIGTWRADKSYYEEGYDSVFSFSEDGTYLASVKNPDTGWAYNEFSIGTFNLDGNTLTLYYGDYEEKGTCSLKDDLLDIKFPSNDSPIPLVRSSESFDAITGLPAPDLKSKSNETTPSTNPTTSTTTYKPGTYKIGVDMPAGLYALIGSGYVEVSSDSSGSSIIDNDNFENVAYVSVQDGEYLKLSRCSAVPEAEFTPKTSDTYSSGMYRVGIDIPSGEYKLTADGGNGYFERNTSAIGAGSDIIDNDNFDGSTYITINDGEFLTLNRCSIVIQ